MHLFIDNISALRFYSMLTTSLDIATKTCSKTVVTDAATSIAAISQFDLSNFDFGSGRLHVLTGDASKRTDAQGVCTHVRSGELPRGSFRSLGDDVFIASPEFCFYEMARHLSFEKLIEFGFLLCGTYTVNPHAEKKNDRPPLSSKRKLQSFALRMTDKRGRSIVLNALGYILEGSASPRETKVAILLTLPVRLGGYGISAPIMNYEIKFSRTEREMFGKTHVDLDLYWPEFNCGIEYDGGENHDGDFNRSRDRRKDGELLYRGISVIRVDKRQLSNPYEVQVLARKLQRKMGMRYRKPTAEQWARKEELFRAIMK